MKNLLIAFVALTSALSYGATKKETWECYQNRSTVLKATFTAKTSVATYSSPDLFGEAVELRFAIKTQETALNGSIKTVLKGEIVDRDSYYYRITLVRTNSEKGGQAIIETTSDLDCLGRALNVEVIDCKVITE